MQRNTYNVAVVGGGFSGAASVYYLLKQCISTGQKLSVVIFNKRGSLGAGVAYGTSSAQHLLNVRANAMSLDLDDPNSFVRWLERHYAEFGASSFVPRFIYSQYVEEQLQVAIADSQGLVHVKYIQQEVRQLDRNSLFGFQLVTHDQQIFLAGSVVLALGTLPERLDLDDQRSVAIAALSSPWDPSLSEKARELDRLALIGSGLTAIDLLLSLEDAGFKGSYHLFSRQARFPEAQPEPPHATDQRSFTYATLIKGAKGVREALRIFRNAVDLGLPWVDLMEALRPQIQQIWQALSTAEQRRFLRHIRPFWELHRHRAPKQSLAKIERLINAGRLFLHQAVLVGAQKLEQGVELKLRDLNSGKLSFQNFPLALNCMGLCSNPNRVDSPLLAHLLKRGLVSTDTLELGLRAQGEGSAIDQAGEPTQGLWVLGALRRGELWESTAARELRSQAKQLAREILNSQAESQRSVSYPVAALQP